MTLDEIQKELDAAREKQRKLRKRIDGFRNTLLLAGRNPDAPKIDLVPRNKNIYKYWKSGKSFVEIAAEVNLSTTRVGSICHRIDAIINKRLPIPKQYRDLARYRTDE